MTVEQEFPRKVRQSLHGTYERGYTVEARITGGPPRKVGDMIVDSKWHEVAMVAGHVGIPAARQRSFLHVVGLMNFQAAQAIRWWFHAEAETDRLGDLCLETRLVEHAIKLDYEVTAVAAHDCIGDKSRSKEAQ